MTANDGAVTDQTRMRLSQQVFALTMALYDTAVANYIERQFSTLYEKTDEEDPDGKKAAKFPELLVKLYRKVQLYDMEKVGIKMEPFIMI